MNTPLLPHRPGTLIGEDFSPFPYLSPFGRLYRLARLNGIWSHQLRQVFNTPPPVLAGLREGHVPWRELYAWEAAMGNRQGDALLPHGWEDWHPYRHRSDIQSSQLRGCRTCLAYGYHTMLHQLPWIARCPWHEETLTDSCLCGQPLLKASRGRNTRLLACECGVDHYERSKGLLGLHQWPSADVHRSLDRYLCSTERARKTTVLVARNTQERQAYARIAHSTVNPWPRSDVFATRVFDETSIDPNLTNEEVGGILRAWWRPPTVMRLEGSYPILKKCFRRLRDYVQREVRTPIGARCPVEISGDIISVFGRPLATQRFEMGRLSEIPAAVEQRAMPWADLGSQLLHSVYDAPPGESYMDRLSQMDELTQWGMQTPAAKVLVQALSALTTFCALDYIRAAVANAQMNTIQSRFTLDLGEPLALVKHSRKFQISIGYLLPQSTVGEEAS